MVAETKIDTSDKSKPAKIRIIIADDHPLMRQALRNSLKKQSDYDIVAEVSDGAEAVKQVRELSPDIVILDISMPSINGIEVTRQISRESPPTAVLVLTVHGDQDTILSALQAGARGFLTKTASGKQVIQAIRTIMSGETVWSLPVSEKITESALQLKNPVTSDSARRLSRRELEILKLMARGASNKEIASRLCIREPSVKSYITNLFVKLNVGTRTEAVSVSLQTGILSIADLKQDVYT